MGEVNDNVSRLMQIRDELQKRGYYSYIRDTTTDKAVFFSQSEPIIEDNIPVLKGKVGIIDMLGSNISVFFEDEQKVEVFDNIDDLIICVDRYLNSDYLVRRIGIKVDDPVLCKIGEKLEGMGFEVVTRESTTGATLYFGKSHMVSPNDNALGCVYYDVYKLKWCYHEYNIDDYRMFDDPNDIVEYIRSSYSGK